MAGHHYETVENNVTGKPVNGATVLVYEDGATKVGDAITSGTLATIYSDDGITLIDQTANPILTDNRGFYEFWTDETVVALAFLYEGSAKRAIIDVEILGGTVSSDVTALSSRVDKHDTVFGLSANATSLGTFTGSTITDNDDVKTALQELETAVETKPVESFIIACSDETSPIAAGTGVVTLRMPYAFTLTGVRASVTTAPTGSTILIDINESGTTILSTKLMIDATEKTSTTAATPAVISDASLADDAEITIDFDQVGSTIAGAGVKVNLIGHRT